MSTSRFAQAWERFSSRDGLEVLLTLSFGLFFGATLVYAMGRLASQWTMFLIAAAVALSGAIVFSVVFKQLRNSLLIGAVFATPIFYDINFFYRDFTPFNVEANGLTISAFDLFFLPLFAFWVLRELFDRSGQHQFVFDAKWSVLLLIMLGLNLLSCLVVSPEPFYSYSMLSWNVRAIMLFFYLINNIEEERTLRTIVYTFAAVLVTQGIIVIEQVFVGAIFTAENLGRETELLSLVGQERVSRVAGTLGHPNNLAMFLNLLLPATVFFFLQEKRSAPRLLLGAGISLGVLAELWTASRGGWVGLLSAMIFTLFLLLRKRGYNLVVVSATTAFLIGVMVLTLFAASSSFRARLTEEDHGTADLRYPLMEVAYNMIAHNPFFGVGLNTYTATMVE